MTTRSDQPSSIDASWQASVCTRSVSDFAHEARRDGESLQQAMERYEIDYAWHVLGSDRLRDDTLAQLAARLGRAATGEQRAQVERLLKDAAEGQLPDLLMSFDNDVAERLAEHLSARWSERSVA